MNIINIIPTGGLCNRMRAIASGVYLAIQYHSTANVIWNVNDGLKAKFEDLFEPIPETLALIKSNDCRLYNIGGKKDYLLRWPFLHLRYQTLFNFSFQNDGDITAHINHRSKRDILLISCYSMCQDYPFDKLFIPQKDIQGRIDNIVRQFTKKTIGIHIRRTDNVEAIKQSPLELFVDKMQKEIDNDSSVLFYLASDDDKIKEVLNCHFPNRIITSKGNTKRNNLEGMKFAVTELYCLSKTSKIIGSHYSSYSHVAAQLGNIPIEYAKK